MKVACHICSREREQTDSVMFTTTPEEKAYHKKMTGQTLSDRIGYCKPCYRLMENPVTAVQMMRGVVEVQLRAAGSPNASQVAERFEKNLLARMKLKQPS